MTAFERVVEAFEAQGLAVTPRGAGRASAQAPGHSPADRSVTITATEGQVLVFSHSDPTDEVLDALSLRSADLFDSPSGATYSYSDGRTVHRTPAKKFRQGGNTAGRAIFRGERVPEAIAAGSPVYVTEGEKDALAIESAGGFAVCSAMGAGKAHLFDWSPLRGATVVIVADMDEPGRRHAAQVAEQLDGIAAAVVIVEAATGKDAADHIAAGHGLDEFVPVEAPSALSVVRLADVQPERVSWLWDGRIPAGKLVTLDGDPSLGKSTLALTFAAVVTTGGAWPDGTACRYPGDVILLSAEDGLADTVRPRLDAAGADVTRVHAVQGVTLPDGTLRPPTLADVAELERLARKTRARLLVVDVLMAYMPSGTDSHKDQDVRRVLSRLSALADNTGCTVLLLRHLNKAKGGDPMYRGGGSIGIVGAARAGMLVARDPDDEEVRVLASTKSNLGPPPEALTYRLASVENLGVARVEWLGASAHDARSLLADASQGDEGERTERDEAAQWLREFLETEGRSLSADAKKAARAAGFSDRTVQRARATLKVRVEYQGRPPVTYWSLPDASCATPRPATPDTPQAGTTGTTSDDQGKQVGTTRPKTELCQPVRDGTTTPASPEIHLCALCGEPCPTNIRSHLECVEAKQDAHRLRAVDAPTPPEIRTPGRRPNQWLGSGEPIEPEEETA